MEDKDIEIVHRLVSVTEAARMSNYSSARIKQMIKDEQLRAEKPQGSFAWLILREDVERLIKNPPKRGRPPRKSA